MSDLKTQLIKLGSTNPELRHHIRAILANDSVMKLWKYNAITGNWVYQRTTSKEDANQWLLIFRKDDPEDAFRISKNKPSGKPKPQDY